MPSVWQRSKAGLVPTQRRWFLASLGQVLSPTSTLSAARYPAMHQPFVPIYHIARRCSKRFAERVVVGAEGLKYLQHSIRVYADYGPIQEYHN